MSPLVLIVAGCAALGVVLYLLSILVQARRAYADGPGVKTSHLHTHEELYRAACNLRPFSMKTPWSVSKQFKGLIGQLDEYVAGGCRDQRLYYEIKGVVEKEIRLLKWARFLNSSVIGAAVGRFVPALRRLRWEPAKRTFLNTLDASFTVSTANNPQAADSTTSSSVVGM